MDSWVNSQEYRTGFAAWQMVNDDVPWLQSQQYRDARVAFKRRIQPGKQKADH